SDSSKRFRACPFQSGKRREDHPAAFLRADDSRRTGFLAQPGCLRETAVPGAALEARLAGELERLR
ncbi:MAG: hypothetical protein OSW77_11360, partial [Proteobacteria bacterium]|nr:hypothetical protein [Pseudomonadota bacterium]